jgi:hypothetical protein
MEIVCIRKYKSQGLQLELTYGKTYEVIPFTRGLEYLPYTKDNYSIKNDRNHINYYSKTDFVTIDEWRELRLKEIGV